MATRSALTGSSSLKPGDSQTDCFNVMPILYKKDQQRTLLDNFVRGASDILGTFQPNMDHFVQLTFALLVPMMMLKNPAFQDEREWRIVRVEAQPNDGGSPLYFRPRQGAIVSFSLIFDGKPFHGCAIQGPTINKELGERP